MAKQKNEMKNLLVIILTVTIAWRIDCQVPSNFRFLNHAQKAKEIYDIKILKDQLISVSNNGLNRINYNYQIDRLKSDVLKYKYYAPNDSSLYYATWLFDGGDHIYEDLEIFSEVNGEVRREDYGSFLVENIHDITYDSLGGWWCLVDEGESIFYLKDNEILSEQRIFQNGSEIYTSCNGDIYILYSNLLQYFNGEQVERILDLPQISSLLNHEGFNYILSENKLYKYGCNFEEQIHEWSLPNQVGSFRQINIGDDNEITISSNTEKDYELITIDEDSRQINSIEGNVGDTEIINGIKKIDETTHLIYGYDQFELGNHNFYRLENSEIRIDYPAVDLEIDEFVINYTTDSVRYYSRVDSLVQTYMFDLSVKATNFGEENIYAFNIYSNRFFLFYPTIIGTTELQYNLRDQILHQEIENISIRFNQVHTFDTIEDIRIAAVGANFKYLQSPIRALQADLVTNTKNIIIKELKLFPNPATTLVNVEIESNSVIRILDTTGKLIDKQQYTKQGTQEIDVNQLNPGTYIILVHGGKSQISLGKFIKL